MKRDRIMLAARVGSGGLMKSWRSIMLYATAAGAFMFLLQRFAQHASADSNLIWATAFGLCAAGLTYMQSIR